MSQDSATSFWNVLHPSAWPDPPSWMSYSTLLDLEGCPRRWALSVAEYPSVFWDKSGYPRLPRQATIEGMIIHMSLQKILRALMENRCASLTDESAILALKELGGYTEVVRDTLKQVLKRYEGNPRAAFALEDIRRRISARIPELRSRVQKLLSRIRPATCRAAVRETDVFYSGTKPRSQLANGSYAEVEIQAIEIGWRGIVDSLTLSNTRCEIRDFKTGVTNQEHVFQIRTYAVLWARDYDLNPAGRLADRLILSYDTGDTEVPAPDEEEIGYLDDELRRRTAKALIKSKANPPEARPSPDNCQHCPVRHLCEEYWHLHARQQNSNGSEISDLRDAQIFLTRQHGPSSWDGIIQSGPQLQIGAPILLRTTNLQVKFEPEQRVRLLNVHIRAPKEEFNGETQPTFVATMGANSEAFLL